MAKTEIKIAEDNFHFKNLKIYYPDKSEISKEDFIEKMKNIMILQMNDVEGV